MPHYADGTEAKIGDQVFGVLYNSGPEPKAGTIISLTPGTDSCNAQVQFTEVMRANQPGEVGGVEPVPADRIPRMALTGDDGRKQVRVVRGEHHGTSGFLYGVAVCVDYCATKELTKTSGPYPCKWCGGKGKVVAGSEGDMFPCDHCHGRGR